MSIGYACLTVGVPHTHIRSLIQKRATDEALREVIEHNLLAFEEMIEYNHRNNIRLFRISSGLIPFGSSPVNQLDWEKEYQPIFERIGKKIKAYHMRVSFHPGQYTVLNSPNEDVVARAIDDLDYHVRVLEALGTDQSHKVVLHVGGIYEDKEVAMKRFVDTFQTLEQRIKDRIIIENDDRLYTIEDVLQLAEICDIPVVYDNLHHAVHPQTPGGTDAYWISKAAETWKGKDGKQKIHYSQQDPGKRPGAHTETIYVEPFLDFYEQLPDQTIDIMLEVKDKNLSAVKAIVATTEPYHVKNVEQEWARYKYMVLEKDPKSYQAIRTLLKDKETNVTVPFYETIEALYSVEPTIGNGVNAGQHVWGYLKEVVTEKEARTFQQRLTRYEAGKLSNQALKRYLEKLVEEYRIPYLASSLYFAF